jgi:hypothetical protein
MKQHYFDQQESDKDDVCLEMAKGQGYVPKTCLLGGMIVMRLVNKGEDPCRGCACFRDKCNGR